MANWCRFRFSVCKFFVFLNNNELTAAGIPVAVVNCDQRSRGFSTRASAFPTARADECRIPVLDPKAYIYTSRGYPEAIWRR